MDKKVKLITEAIAKAERFESKLTPEVIDVPFLGSLKIRALLNNLGEFGTHFLEVGSHKGGSFCSTIFGNSNLKSITAIDSWESDEINEDKAYPQFMENTRRFKPVDTELHVIVADCFEVHLEDIKHPIDIYGYDAGHSFEDQKRALTYYKPVLADKFIYCCDDWTYGEVKEGTLAGIKEAGYKVLFEKELLNTTPGDGHLNDEWWRGYGVFLLKKK